MSRLRARRWGARLTALLSRVPGHGALAGVALASACGGAPDRDDPAPPEPAGDVASPGLRPPAAPGAGDEAGGVDDATGAEPSVGNGEGVDVATELDPEQTAGSGAASEADPGDAEPSAAPAPEPSTPVTVYLAGDSIVQSYADTASGRDQAGWGQMLEGLLDPRVTVDNRAIGGRTARRFIDEGRLTQLVDELEPGDYLLAQFGTNDGNRTATYTLGDETIPYFLDPATDFKLYLQRYVDAAQSRGATPVLVTPTPRNSAYCTGGNGTGGHAAAMRELGEDSGVAVVDLNAQAVAYLRAICPAPTPEDFFLLRADGTVDGTHFQENGARILAGFVADGLREAGLPLVSRSEGAP